MTALAGAACGAPGVDPEWWTGARGEGHAQAARVCAGCPVREACARLAEDERTTYRPVRYGDTTLRPIGVWAGRLYDGTRSPSTPVRLETPCGTCGRLFVPHKGNVRHCAGCREAGKAALIRAQRERMRGAA